MSFLADISPAWLQREYGAKLLSVIGDELNNGIDATRSAIFAPWPTLGAYDAKALIGAMRGLEQGSAETDEAYQARIADPWAQWYWAGTAKGILNAVARTGVDAQYWGDLTWSTTGTWGDGGDAWIIAGDGVWCGLSIVLNAPAAGYSIDDETWDSATGWDLWDEPVGVWDSDVPLAQVNEWRALLDTWGPAFANPKRIILILSDGGFADVWGAGAWDTADEGNWDDDAETIVIEVN